MTSPTRDLWHDLALPFTPDDVSLEVQDVSPDEKHGRVVAYLDARRVMDRLDAVVGTEGWSDQYERLGQGTNGCAVKCRLTILGLSKEDAGVGDTFRSACSDALTRAAVKFGVGRKLYASSGVWVDLDEHGQIVDELQTKTHILQRQRQPAHRVRRDSGTRALPFWLDSSARRPQRAPLNEELDTVSWKAHAARSTPADPAAS